MPQKVHVNKIINEKLSDEDIFAILRAADEIIAHGGRTLLAKILKGSREKKVLELGLNDCPSYGYYKLFSLEQIVNKIDWMIHHDFLEIQFSGKLPMIVFTERGWSIERARMAEELLQEWDAWLAQGITDVNMSYLKDRNRGMILMFLDKIKQTGNPKYIPLLRLWEKIEYKKVQQEIRDTVCQLERSIH
ncbi:MAG: RQC-minor-1 family DNA-binding protein [Bacillota bacterium]